MKTLTSEEALKSDFNKPNIQICEFCGKECKSINSYKQHRCRCKNNPDRIESASRDFKEQYKNLSQDAKERMAWSKGLTKDTDERIKSSALKHRGKHNTNYENNIYKDQNELEVLKWFDYIKSKDVPENLNTSCAKNSYPVIKNSWTRENKTVKFIFAHDYVANILLDGNLSVKNTVHHIDKDITNYDKFNLLVFETNSDHKRFHNSKYARLKYNEDSHLFTSYIDNK